MRASSIEASHSVARLVLSPVWLVAQVPGVGIARRDAGSRESHVVMGCLRGGTDSTTQEKGGRRSSLRRESMLALGSA
jgi:hypothetical protein